ncbi:metallophosphoesterase [Candidatus Woesearchaeota archaeon]|nr:metallophosphoesterase [Candidatus Woesearchaeota archaeon]
MALDDLVLIPTTQFMNGTLNRDSKLKIASTDDFSKSIDFLSGKLASRHRRVIVGNAGGSDTLLSLYANLRLHSPRNSVTHLVSVDSNSNNLMNLYYRTVLAHFNPQDIAGYVSDLFGISKRGFKTKFEDIISGENKFDLLKQLLGSSEYNPSQHLGSLLEMSQEIPDGIDEWFYKQSVSAVSTFLSDKKNYRTFVDNFVNSIQNNKSHYLTDTKLYSKVVGLINSKFDRSFLHLLDYDLSSPDGLNSFVEFVDKTGLDKGQTRPIAVSFFPHFMRDLNNLSSYLKYNSDYVMFSNRKSEEQNRHCVVVSNREISSALENNDFLKKYKDEIKDRVPFSMVSSFSPKPKGLEPTAFLSHLSIGYDLFDEKSLTDMVEVINKSSVKNVIVGGGIYGPHFFIENDKRLRGDNDYSTLDSQLRKLHSVFESIEAPVTYLLSDEDKRIWQNLVNLYMNAKKSSETGRVETGSGLAPYNRRAFYNSSLDTVKKALWEVAMPYLIRSGQDPFSFYSEESVERILDVADVFIKILDGKSLSSEDRRLVNPKYLTDSSRLKVVFDGTAVLGSENFSGVKLFKNSLFSDITQYMNPTVGLEEVAKLSQNGTLNSVVKEEILADFQQSYQSVRIMGNKLILFTPHMVDDRRLYDGESVNKFSDVLADPAHKRRTITKRLNLPGSWIVSGSIDDRLYVKPFYPKIWDRVSSVNKSGEGYRHKTILVLNDVQLNSITERPDYFVNFMDYALFERGATVVLGVGDFIQGRNYHGMPIENAVLGGLTTSSMEESFVNLVRPYLTLEQIEAIMVVPGNHEWNTDKMYFGTTYVTALKSMLKENKLMSGRSVVLDFPEFVLDQTGNVMRTPSSMFKVNDLTYLAQHVFSEKGAGKGSSTRPSTHLLSYNRNMGHFASSVDFMIGAHYHIFDIAASENVMAVIAGGMAGLSGYEQQRQYGDGAGPVGVLIDSFPDGSLGIEAVTWNFLSSYSARHPLVSSKGVDSFVNDCFAIDVSSQMYKPGDRQKLFKREFRYNNPVEIK